MINAIQSFSFQLFELLLIIRSKSVKVTSKQCSGATLIKVFFWIKLFKVIFQSFSNREVTKPDENTGSD